MPRGLSWLDRSTSRRGFLARVGGAMVGGAAVLTGDAAESWATVDQNPPCCSQNQCPNCPSTLSKCPSPYKYSGYTWTCCSNHRIAYCWDCNYQSGGYACTCGKLTGGTC